MTSRPAHSLDGFGQRGGVSSSPSLSAACPIREPRSETARELGIRAYDHFVLNRSALGVVQGEFYAGVNVPLAYVSILGGEA